MTDLDVVAAWHEAVNAGDADRVVALADEGIEIAGPRGVGSGVELLREWVGRAGIRLESGRVFHRPGTVVVDQMARWSDTEVGRAVGSVFKIRDGRIVYLARHPDLASAL